MFVKVKFPIGKSTEFICVVVELSQRLSVKRTAENSPKASRNFSDLFRDSHTDINYVDSGFSFEFEILSWQASRRNVI